MFSHIRPTFDLLYKISKWLKIFKLITQVNGNICKVNTCHCQFPTISALGMKDLEIQPKHGQRLNWLSCFEKTLGFRLTYATLFVTQTWTTSSFLTPLKLYVGLQTKTEIFKYIYHIRISLWKRAQGHRLISVPQPSIKINKNPFKQPLAYCCSCSTTHYTFQFEEQQIRGSAIKTNLVSSARFSNSSE